MNKSAQINELAAALSIVQGQLRPAEENAINPFLKNRYADLASVWDVCRPLLAEYGLSIAQFPTSDGGTIGLTTILSHKSGQWMEDTVYLPLANEKGKSQAQVAGSIISYLRRYALASVLGIITGEDDDGNAGQDQHNPSTRKPQAAPNGSSAFWETAQKRIPYFRAAKHAENAAGKLGLAYPQTKDEAAAALTVLEQYAQLRADGMEQDEAVAKVRGTDE